MEKALDVAAYICGRYQEAYGQKIDEMKLHKLMYFAQREALIQTDAPLFDGEFRGWKYGPVLKELRKPYQEDALSAAVEDETAEKLKSVMDTVFGEYAEMNSFSLSRLTHSEISWRRSRKGVSPAENSDRPISLDDIREDADRIRKRREMLKQQGVL